MEKYLSEVELYYSTNVDDQKKQIILDSDEFKHIVKVMRHREGDLIYITDGIGKIYKSNISKILKGSVVIKIKDFIEQPNLLRNITFCIPILKNPDRLRFAIEKCVELGVTEFILFTSKRTIGKAKSNERLNRILLSAMKQSLRAYLPKIRIMKLDEIMKLDGNKILFDQNTKRKFSGEIDKNRSVYFIFGPEGGFEKEELKFFSEDNFFSLSDSRLRSETAVVVCASLL